MGIPTGPARFFVVDTYLNNGRRAAIRVYLGFFGALSVYAGLALIASDFLSRNNRLENISYLVGSFLLIAWGIFILFKSKKSSDSSIKVGFDSFEAKGFITGMSSPVTPFLFLTLIQLLRFQLEEASVWTFLIYLLIFEGSSCITNFSIAYLAHKKEGKMKKNWKSAKIIMGVFIILIGSFNLYQMLDFKNGISFSKGQNLLEEQVEN
ncbi:MAG TPA: LysE family transporter [Salinimicrobium sp.]|nr:LysE family transporter [Salinimicrobium sp.]